MKRLIIAMNDKHQSQKLAIVLSSSYESVIVNSPSKLRSYIMNDTEAFFSIIYEDNKTEDAFNLEIESLIKAGSISNPVIKITSEDTTESDTATKLILKKPFGVKELIHAANTLETLSSSSSIAIA